MSLYRRLRLREESKHHLKQLSYRLIGSEISPPDQQARYLQVQLYDDHNNQAYAWFDVDRWLNVMSLELPAIPWQEVPISYLTNWLAGLELNFQYAETLWRVADLRLYEKDLPAEIVFLPTSPIPICCVDWPDMDNERQSAKLIPLQLISFRVQFNFGRRPLSLSTLADLNVGDLLLLKQPSIYLTIGQHRLFRVNYTLHQEVIVEEQYIKYEEESREEDEPLYDWENLTVDLEFVLEANRMTIAELENIRLGTALPIPHGAEQNMKIYINKQLFARGELVALENGTLAVEVNHVNPKLTGGMDLSDVE